MGDWWQRDLIDADKLALMLCFVAFVVTFLLTRLITRGIRAGRGPFHDNVTGGGTHVHHAVPGIVLLVVGAFLAVGAPADGPWGVVAGVLVGVKTSLVLDEFALILHLEDVYWSGEGQLSVSLVSLTAACLGLTLVRLSPLGVDDVGGGELGARLGASGALVLHGALTVGGPGGAPGGRVRRALGAGPAALGRLDRRDADAGRDAFPGRMTWGRCICCGHSVAVRGTR